MSGFRVLLPLVLLFGLSACAESVWAPDEAITKSSYVHEGPPTITLVTIINNNTGEGGHSAIVINAHERVVFDPAGNFKSTLAPERNDLVYGMNPPVLRAYYGFHARTEWHVVTQEKEVTPEIAALAFKLSQEHGAVANAMCANSVTTILNKIPGFESIPVRYSPKKTMKTFAQLADVKTEKIFEYD